MPTKIRARREKRRREREKRKEKEDRKHQVIFKQEEVPKQVSIMPVEEDIEKMLYKVRKPLRCKYCPISFASLDSYRQHTIKHRRKYLKRFRVEHKTHLAPIVFEILDDDESVEKTIDNHTDNNAAGYVKVGYVVTRDISSRRCNRCFLLFRDRQELQEHMQTKHSGYGFAKEAIKSLTCPRCFKDFVYHSDFTTEKKCNCPYCKIYFEQVVDEDGEKLNKVLTSPFDCPKCNEIYRQQYKLVTEEVEIQGGKLCKKHLEITCHVCKRKFTKPHFLKMHMRVHNKKKKKRLATATEPVTCEICKKVFKKKRYLVLHMNRGSCKVQEKTPYYCEMCNKYFTVQKNLAAHYSRVHMERAVRCQYCKKSVEMFSDKSALLEHQQKVHRNERENRKKSFENDSKQKNLQYEQKRYEMKYDNNLNHVEELETNDRLLQCQLCPKYFKGKSFLVEHYKRIHKVDNQWVYTKFASMSDRSMKSKKSKKSKKHRHKSKHKEHRSREGMTKNALSPSLQDFLDGDEVHQCELCPARYESRKAMLQHMRRRHGLSHNAILTKDYKCHLCRQTFVVEENLKQHIVQKHNHVSGHESSGKFKCGYCYLAFGDRNQLTRHMISNHLDDHL